MKTVKEIADSVVQRDLVGYNIHYRPDTGEWNIWARVRNSDGWSISGLHSDLALALDGVVRQIELDADDDDIGDLV